MQTGNKTILITGASGGIGFELAKCFAKRQHDLVIVSRNEERLLEVAHELRTWGAPKVTVIAKDLFFPHSAAEIYTQIKQMGIQVDILVNNAGMGEYGLFTETDLEKELNIIQLNIASLVHLTKLYMKDMLQRNQGKILQVASVASYQPTPLLAVYAATKAFVLSFTDALINELQGSNVTMTALIPGATATDFFRKAGAEDTKAATDNPEDPAIVAETGYTALMNGDKHALAPGVMPVIVMSSAMPNDAVAAMARKSMEPAGKT